MNIAMCIDDERLMADPLAYEAIGEHLTDAGHAITRLLQGDPGHAIIEANDVEDDQPPWAEGQYRVMMHGMPWTQSAVARRLEASVMEHEPHIIWAIGVRTWSLARRLANRLRCPLAIQVWCPSVARKAVRGRHITEASFIVPTRALADWMRTRVDDHLVSLVPPGIEPLTPDEHAVGEATGLTSLAVLGRGRDASAYGALLGGVRQTVMEFSTIHLFMELQGRRDHDIWRHLQRLELLDRTSTFPRAVPVHRLVAACHALILPERYGEVHSIMLEAMRDGVPIVASEDPALAGVIDERNAAIVREQTVENWSQQLRRLLAHPDEAAERALVAAERVATAFRRDRQIEILADTFERMIHGMSYPFESEASARLSD